MTLKHVCKSFIHKVGFSQALRTLKTIIQLYERAYGFYKINRCEQIGSVGRYILTIVPSGNNVVYQCIYKHNMRGIQ